jgi:tetraprenyl-beta-curcumene synthase
MIVVVNTLSHQRTPTAQAPDEDLSVDTRREQEARSAQPPRRSELLGGLVRAASRELLWGLRAVSREAELWQARASAIPDPRIRADALTALHRKRGNINGAALFWTLPNRRDRALLQALIAYETLADFLDCVNESEIHLGVCHGDQLQLALQDALDSDAERSDYYLYRTSGDDGGYLQELVLTCRRACLRLPSFERVRPYVLRAAALSPVLSLNHEPDPAERTRLLQDWTGDNLPVSTAPMTHGSLRGELSWFERTAGASAWLTVLAMLALAAEPAESAPSSVEIESVYDAYLTWIAPVGAMLDSYSDILDDQATGDHSYISYYPTMETAVARVNQLVGEARDAAVLLPNGSRHVVVIACMIAFYLSKDSVRAPAMRTSTRELRRAGGPLVGMLVPILRAWRTIYGQCST